MAGNHMVMQALLYLAPAGIAKERVAAAPGHPGALPLALAAMEFLSLLLAQRISMQVVEVAVVKLEITWEVLVGVAQAPACGMTYRFMVVFNRPPHQVREFVDSMHARLHFLVAVVVELVQCIVIPCIVKVKSQGEMAEVATLEWSSST